MLKTRTWIALVCAAALISGVLSLRLLTGRREGTVVEVMQDGAVIREIDLSCVSAEYAFTVTCPDGGENTILVEPGRICVSAADALGILLARVLLGGMFSGAMMTLFYSLSGGLLCWLLMLPLRRILTKQQIWVCGVLGAVAHNVGQTLAAIAVFRTLAVAAYFPLLVLSGILAGLFTGLCAQFVVSRAHLTEW